MIPIGYEDAVHRNWLYAAERVLGRAGAAVQSVRTFAELPPQLESGDTLLLNTPGYALAPERISALLAWVADGGHLLCAAYQVYPSGEISDPLWDALELQIEMGEPAREPVAVRLNPQAPELRVAFWQTYRLRTANEVVLTGNPEQDGRLLRFDWGRGRVIDQNLVKVRVVEKNLSRVWPDEGCQVRVRKRIPERPDQRRREDDVPDAIGADNENSGMFGHTKRCVSLNIPKFAVEWRSPACSASPCESRGLSLVMRPTVAERAPL